jgi:hypothetical protein
VCERNVLKRGETVKDPLGRENRCCQRGAKAMEKHCSEESSKDGADHCGGLLDQLDSRAGS